MPTASTMAVAVRSTDRRCRARHPASMHRARQREPERRRRVEQRHLDAVVRGEQSVLQCTVIAATIITEIMSAGPIGPRKPSATSRPLAISVTDAAAAKVRPGRKPRWTKNSPVLFEPVASEPPKQLLRAVRRHQEADDEPERSEARCSASGDPLRLCSWCDSPQAIVRLLFVTISNLRGRSRLEEGTRMCPGHFGVTNGQRPTRSDPPELEYTPANCHARDMLARVGDKWSVYVIHVLGDAADAALQRAAKRRWTASASAC